MKDCIFCQIAKGEIPKDFVYQDEAIVAFDDIYPLAPLHILIIPKKHIKGVQTAQKKDQELLGKMLLIGQEIARKKKLKGYRLFFNCGKIGGQAIFHLHLHLVGGWKDLPEFNDLVEKRMREGGVL